jgi:hypothetical protein
MPGGIAGEDAIVAAGAGVVLQGGKRRYNRRSAPACAMTDNRHHVRPQNRNHAQIARAVSGELPKVSGAVRPEQDPESTQFFAPAAWVET